MNRETSDTQHRLSCHAYLYTLFLPSTVVTPSLMASCGSFSGGDESMKGEWETVQFWFWLGKKWLILSKGVARGVHLWNARR